MTTDQQVRRLMSMMEKGVPLLTAAAKAGMSEPTARKWQRLGRRPSEVKAKHTWRTRPDPFIDVWPEVVALLERDAGLEAKTVFWELQRRYPERFQAGQLRTLQRRFRDWRALQGPALEVFFPQVHCPGEQCQSDFTDMSALGVMIGGEPYPHLLYHFVLTYSNWEWVAICFSETFEALSEGLQGALWRLGAIPAEHRTDNLSAVTRELRLSRGRGFTARYQELLAHYGLKASKNSPGRAHENGDVESAHGGLKGVVDQRLRLHGHRDFGSVEAYWAFLEALIAERNAARKAKLAEELAAMRPLPVGPLDTCRELVATVSRASTIRVVGKTYSVPARLRGYRVRVRLSATEVEVSYQGHVVERFPRVHGQGAARIDYRHIIHSLIRKPGAFRRFAFREALFPTLTFRRAYDALQECSDTWADLEYVRILHLAATTLESTVEEALAALIEAGTVPTYEVVKARVAPTPPLVCPEVQVAPPDLKVYDALLSGQAVAV
jgi:transposase